MQKYHKEEYLKTSFFYPAPLKINIFLIVSICIIFFLGAQNSVQTTKQTPQTLPFYNAFRAYLILGKGTKMKRFSCSTEDYSPCTVQKQLKGKSLSLNRSD